MKKPEPIELENNLGPDAVTGEINRVPWMAYDVDEMDLYIAELEQKLAEKDKEIESLKASHYAEMVDAGMRERRLKRALWLARAKRNKALAAIVHCQGAWYDTLDTKQSGKFWNKGGKLLNASKKCRAKAEEYK